MELPEERTLGGELGAGQDVTIILVSKGGSTIQKLALIHLHSNVLATHSNYFNTCLSERWKNQSAWPASLIEFVLEVHTDAEIYFDCFSNMYPPPVKTFQGVKHGVELLKVASQIDYPELMERISLYLSTMLWSEEDEIRVREYSSSPDFPRIHLKDLVARLGLDESEQDCQKQLCDLVRVWIRPGLNGFASGGADAFLTEVLQNTRHGAPSNHARMVVIAIVSEEAKKLFVKSKKDWNGMSLITSPPPRMSTIILRIESMCWILKALLEAQVAEDLVQDIVHLDAIPKYISELNDDLAKSAKKAFAGLVLVLYEEVAAGFLLLRLPERMALLVNWHSLVKSALKEGSYEQAT